MEVFSRLLNHTDTRVQLEVIGIVNTLCHTHRAATAQFAPVLAKLLVHSDPEIRQNTARIFNEFGSEARHAVLNLRKTLLDERPLTRAFSAVTLGKLQVIEVMPRIAEMLENPETALWAADAIQVAGPVAIGILPQIRQVLKPTLTRSAEAWAQRLPGLHRLDDFRIRLILAVGAMGPTAVAALPELQYHLANPGTMLAAADALGAFGEQASAAIPDLKRELQGQEPQSIRAAARALGRIGPKAEVALPALKRLLDLEDFQIRAEIALAIFRIEAQHETVFPWLLSVYAPNAQGQQDRHAMATAAAAIGEIGPPAITALPLLREHLQSELVWLGVPVARAIWTITQDAPLVLPALASLIGNTWWR
jgi:HEAT repeat protein